MANFSLDFSMLSDSDDPDLAYMFEDVDDSVPKFEPDEGAVFFYPLEVIIIEWLILVVCILGLVGNGMVIFLVGFRVKKNRFIAYILNLTIADLGVLVFRVLCFYIIFFEEVVFPLQSIYFQGFLVSYNTGIFLLTAIGIERCVFLLNPVWHRNHRPSYLTPLVCGLLWAVSMLLNSALLLVTIFSYLDGYHITPVYQFYVTGILFLPMIITTIILFRKLNSKSQQLQQGKHLMTIAVTLLFSIFFSLPMNIIYFVNRSFYQYEFYLTELGFLCAVINCSVNPLIYYLVGRRKGAQPREGFKIVLQRVFNEEESNASPIILPS